MNQQVSREQLIKLNDNLYEIAQTFRADMRVPARIYMNEAILEDVLQDRALWQLINVATLPGIQKYALAMPDIHQGYGFPIGGIAATAINEGGVISPGGIGYDINCGVRLLAAKLRYQDIKPQLEKLATALFHKVPSGVGRGGVIKMKSADLDKVLQQGARRMVELGFGNEDDLAHCEDEGAMSWADSRSISFRAKKRGSDQLGTLGSGNHFLEVQRVEEIYDEKVAQIFGLERDAVTIMIHCGSRGLGHQTCTDYVRQMIPQMKDFNITLPDRELVCAPFTSQVAQDYFSAMAAAANFAWANRHMIGHWVREVWHETFGTDAALSTVYDVSHNIGKREVHVIDGKKVDVIIHRKGATRSFGPGHPDTPECYRAVGQPVFIPGTMGTSSYVLVGTEKGMDLSFGSSCHGAGRRLSRTQAKKEVEGTELRERLEARGIIMRCDSDRGLAEEAPVAYKDVDNVVQVVHNAGLARKVVRLKPIAVIKGG